MDWLYTPTVPNWFFMLIVIMLALRGNYLYRKGRADERKGNLNELIRSRPCLYDGEKDCDERQHP